MLSKRGAVSQIRRRNALVNDNVTPLKSILLYAPNSATEYPNGTWFNAPDSRQRANRIARRTLAERPDAPSIPVVADRDLAGL